MSKRLRTRLLSVRADVEGVAFGIAVLASALFLLGAAALLPLGRHAHPGANRWSAMEERASDTWHRLVALTRQGFELQAPANPGRARGDAPRPQAWLQLASTINGLSTTVPVHSLEALLDRFDALAYDLADIRKGVADVPRAYLTALPDDMAGVAETDKRKHAFVKAILPLILKTNETIAADRARLLRLEARLDRGELVPAAEVAWLEELAGRYGIAVGNLKELKRRVDVIPPSLALAQAAEESGWGTSRFALLGNAIYGQWTAADNGMVPENRSDGARHQVRAFEALESSVAAYMTNLNTHNAYREFRARRADLRARGKALDGNLLAPSLHRYSQRGQDYVTTIRTIIKANELEHFDKVRLTDAPRLAQMARAGGAS